jgi:quercetin dioxygenase-like cupin family protein
MPWPNLINSQSTKQTEELFMKRVILSIAAGGALVGAPLLLRAQDPVKVDPKHYKVEFENNEVRMLRINYGPGEKSVMHVHPETVAVFLADQKATFTTPDGKTTEVDAKAGEVKSIPAGAHLPQNIGDKPMELILVEFKNKPAAK